MFPTGHIQVISWSIHHVFSRGRSEIIAVTVGGDVKYRAPSRPDVSRIRRTMMPRNWRLSGDRIGGFGSPCAGKVDGSRFVGRIPCMRRGRMSKKWTPTINSPRGILPSTGGCLGGSLQNFLPFQSSSARRADARRGLGNRHGLEASQSRTILTTCHRPPYAMTRTVQEASWPLSW